METHGKENGCLQGIVKMEYIPKHWKISDLGSDLYRVEFDGRWISDCVEAQEETKESPGWVIIRHTVSSGAFGTRHKYETKYGKVFIVRIK